MQQTKKDFFRPTLFDSHAPPIDPTAPPIRKIDTTDAHNISKSSGDSATSYDSKIVSLHHSLMY